MIKYKSSKQQTTINQKPLTWIKDCITLAKPFWISSEKYKAISLITIIIILNLAQVWITVILNKWYNSFYTALQNYDKASFSILIIRFCFIAFIAITCGVLASLFLKFLEIKWRKWLINYYLNNWFNDKAFYKTRFLDQISDNPDQRISEDINSFIILTLSLTLGLLNSLVTLFSFIFILWNLSGNLNFSIGTEHFTIYGYLVWAALIYAIIGTYITFKIGKPLVKLDFQQQAYEAGFRYSLVRIREYNENIAFFSGENKEHHNIMYYFKLVVNNFVDIIYREMKIGIFGIGYAQIAIIFPFLVAAPKYFSKIIKLGDVMQISNAFGNVLNSLSFFVNSYSSLCGWRATMDRLIGFQRDIEEASKLTGLETKSGNNILELKNIDLHLPDGTFLAKNISFTLNSGDKLLIQGKSGCGKTSILRAIAKLWHLADGNIYQKPGVQSLFISQMPYLPIDSLAFAISYPKAQHLPDEVQLKDILIKCHLSHLIDHLYGINDWSKILSPGEQQRVAFCRILINKPDIVYLDESTSALDEETEDELYKLLTTELPNIVIVSIAHRSNLAKWHNQNLNFNTLVG
ncbi:MAG: ABC transporter ATP-binding protein/permease [Neisseriaceae bacterium]